MLFTWLRISKGNGRAQEALKRFSDDIRAFFRAIGVNDDVELIVLPSGERQQNIKVHALGIEWVFQQERGDQDVALVNPAFPNVHISVQQLDFCLRPPTREQMRQIAESDEFLHRYESLAHAASYVRDHLPEISRLILSDQIVQTASKLRVAIKGIFDAVKQSAPTI